MGVNQFLPFILVFCTLLQLFWLSDVGAFPPYPGEAFLSQLSWNMFALEYMETGSCRYYLAFPCFYALRILVLHINIEPQHRVFPSCSKRSRAGMENKKEDTARSQHMFPGKFSSHDLNWESRFLDKTAFSTCPSIGILYWVYDVLVDSGTMKQMQTEILGLWDWLGMNNWSELPYI